MSNVMDVVAVGIRASHAQAYSMICTVIVGVVLVLLCRQLLIYVGKRELLKITRAYEKKAAEERNSLKLTETFREYNS